MTTASEEAQPPQDDLLPPLEETPVSLPDPVAVPDEPPVQQARPLAIPTRTLPLLLILLATGAVVLLFALLTVHRRAPEDLAKNPASARAHLQITHWLEKGYFSSGGLLVWKDAKVPLYFYQSSTGGMLLSGFLTEKLYYTFTGRYSWRLHALHNQVFTMLTAAFLGLLAFRVAQRIGAHPLHALAIAVSTEAVFFTFPDNLFDFWEMTARIPWLLFCCVFLLLEERLLDRRTRVLTFAQAAAAFLLTYMEHVAGLAFIVSYFIVKLLLTRERPEVKRLILTSLAPMFLAMAVYAGQLSWMKYLHPNVPFIGADFYSRSGLDGSTKYYVDHLDIARRRDIARADWPKPNNAHLFRWKWLFWAGATALVAAVIAAMAGRIPSVAMIALLSLLGAYLFYAAVFTQAVIIHPYLYDVMLFTPLIFALFAIAPALVESLTGHRGIAVAAVFFLAVWVSMSQLRKYALMYPPTPPKKVASIAAPSVLPL